MYRVVDVSLYLLTPPTVFSSDPLILGVDWLNTTWVSSTFCRSVLLASRISLSTFCWASLELMVRASASLNPFRDASLTLNEMFFAHIVVVLV